MTGAPGLMSGAHQAHRVKVLSTNHCQLTLTLAIRN